MGTYSTRLRDGGDIARLVTADRKEFQALSMPLTGVRFDRRTLELIDTDHDGRIRVGEIVGAIKFLQEQGVDLQELFDPKESDRARLDELVKHQPPTPEPSAASKAVWAAESVIDAYFAIPDDLPLVTAEPDRPLPLGATLNPKYAPLLKTLIKECALENKAELTREEWSELKSANPRLPPPPKADETEERVLRYKLYLLELLQNFVNMKKLYTKGEMAIFQTGTLRIDSKEMVLCFHVDNVTAHSALVEKSNCCVIYLALKRPGEGKERNICAVVTAGTIAGLYVGRNGVFQDRDGLDWEATVTKVVESQVSLCEAFWAPWRKVGDGIAGAVKKFLGDKQAKALGDVTAATAQAPQQSQSGNGAALASSVAAIGIGIGMVGAAFASIMAAISSMPAWKIAAGVLAIVALVSIPSVILCYFKLRRRDLGAILNACGWAINRPMRMSMSLARSFTVTR